MRDDFQFEHVDRKRRVATRIGIAGFFVLPFIFMKIVYMPQDELGRAGLFLILGISWLCLWFLAATRLEKRRRSA